MPDCAIVLKARIVCTPLGSVAFATFGKKGLNVPSSQKLQTQHYPSVRVALCEERLLLDTGGEIPPVYSILIINSTCFDSVGDSIIVLRVRW